MEYETKGRGGSHAKHPVVEVKSLRLHLKVGFGRVCVRHHPSIRRRPTGRQAGRQAGSQEATGHTSDEFHSEYSHLKWYVREVPPVHDGGDLVGPL